ncbi:MAG: VanZ family protein [Tannerella sp.]|jgi:hypothetical protein|nr:VanZ family protein [Tannerella sp.]
MFRHIKRYPFSITVVLTVIYLSLVNPPSLDIPLFPGWDKAVHFCMYGGMSGIVWLEYLFDHRRNRPSLKTGILAGAVCPLILGGLLEIGQSVLTESRSGDWLDFAANAGGIVAASAIAWALLRRWIVKP